MLFMNSLSELALYEYHTFSVGFVKRQTGFKCVTNSVACFSPGSASVLRRVEGSLLQHHFRENSDFKQN